MIYVVLCAFIPLLVFLHGCVQCVYPPSMWQAHLSLGSSICICHHGPHHLQSQVLPPTVSSPSVARPETSIVVRFQCGLPKGTVCPFCVLFCMLPLGDTHCSHYIHFHCHSDRTTWQPLSVYQQTYSLMYLFLLNAYYCCILRKGGETVGRGAMRRVARQKQIMKTHDLKYEEAREMQYDKNV